MGVGAISWSFRNSWGSSFMLHAAPGLLQPGCWTFWGNWHHEGKNLSLEAVYDILWFRAFLPVFYRVTLIRAETAAQVVSLDTCPGSGGGLWQGAEFYSKQFPQYLTDFGLSISSVECFNMLVAVRLWVARWQGECVLLYCDSPHSQ